MKFDLSKYNEFTLSYENKTRTIERSFAQTLLNETVAHITGEKIDHDLSSASVIRMNDNSIVVVRVAYDVTCTMICK